VRPARDADVALLPAIERAAAALFPPDRVGDPTETLPEAALRRYLADGLLWVAEDADGVLGFVAADRRDDALHVVEVDVDPRHGRRGIGTALLRRVCSVAAEQGLDAVTLTTFADLPWNGPFYARLGFRELGPGERGEALERLLDEERRAGLTRRIAMRWSAESFE
jgi:GNAT superfamily N-acetyltransferase